ncbi:MAG: hypothetical protein U0105_12255 [Candidatus Obscuribacterales bacterium]
MSTAYKEIHEYIALLDREKIFGSVELQRLGTPAQISRVCKRLEQKKQIIRLAYGLYIKGSPDDTLLPDALEIACAKAEIHQSFVVGYRHQLWRHFGSPEGSDCHHFLALGYSCLFQSVHGQIALHGINTSRLTLWNQTQIEAARATGSSKAFLEMTSGKLIGIPAHQAVKLYGKDLDYNYIPGDGQYEDYDDEAGMDRSEDYDDLDEDPEDCWNDEEIAHYVAMRVTTEQTIEQQAKQQQALEQQALNEGDLDFAPDQDEPLPPTTSTAPSPVASADGEERQRRSNFYIDPEEEEMLACNNAGAIIRKTVLRIYH